MWREEGRDVKKSCRDVTSDSWMKLSTNFPSFFLVSDCFIGKLSLPGPGVYRKNVTGGLSENCQYWGFIWQNPPYRGFIGFYLHFGGLPPAPREGVKSARMPCSPGIKSYDVVLTKGASSPQRMDGVWKRAQKSSFSKFLGLWSVVQLDHKCEKNIARKSRNSCGWSVGKWAPRAYLQILSQLFSNMKPNTNAQRLPQLCNLLRSAWQTLAPTC